MQKNVVEYCIYNFEYCTIHSRERWRNRFSSKTIFMKKKNYIIAFFLFFSLPIIGFSQNLQTSTDLSTERITLLEKASHAVVENQYQSANDYVIPLTIHILHETDGSGGDVSDNDVLETFCDAVAYYAEYGITLYIDTIQHINNSNFYTDYGLNGIYIECREHRQHIYA